MKVASGLLISMLALFTVLSGQLAYGQAAGYVYKDEHGFIVQRYGQIGDPLSPEWAQDVFQRSGGLGLSVHVINGGTAITATATGGGGMYIGSRGQFGVVTYNTPMPPQTVAAKALGVDHLGWEQKIVFAPFTYERYHNGAFAGNVPFPVLDPIMNYPEDEYRIATSGIAEPRPIDVPFRFQDNHTPYYADWVGYKNFYDSPHKLPGTYGIGDYQYFETRLVGINSFGDVQRRFNYVFHWKSDVQRNSTGQGGSISIERDSVDMDDELPEYVSGGIFDVVIDVPEPSSMVLAAAGFAGLIGWRWRNKPREATTYLMQAKVAQWKRHTYTL